MNTFSNGRLQISYYSRTKNRKWPPWSIHFVYGHKYQFYFLKYGIRCVRAPYLTVILWLKWIIVIPKRRKHCSSCITWLYGRLFKEERILYWPGLLPSSFQESRCHLVCFKWGLRPVSQIYKGPCRVGWDTGQMVSDGRWETISAPLESPGPYDGFCSCFKCVRFHSLCLRTFI